jgi:hypothetical protein
MALSYMPERIEAADWVCRLYVKDSDVLCHVVLPEDHWIWRTYAARVDPSAAAVSRLFGAPPPEPFAPTNRSGRELDLEDVLRSPEPLTLWKSSTHTVGWYGTRDLAKNVEAFREMVQWLLDPASKAEFDTLLDG